MKWGLGLGAWGLGLFLPFPASAQTATPDAGVPLDVATHRAANISDLRYELALSIPEAIASPLTGTTTIRFTLKDPKAPLVIDFETSRDHVKSVEANGTAAAFAHRERTHRGPGGVARERREHDPHRVQCRRCVAESQQRFSLYPLRAGPRAAGACRCSISPT